MAETNTKPHVEKTFTFKGTQRKYWDFEINTVLTIIILFAIYNSSNTIHSGKDIGKELKWINLFVILRFGKSTR